MINSAALKTFEQILNKTLQLDDYYQEKLLKLSDKTIKIIVQPFNKTLYVQFSNSSIYLLNEYADSADTTIESTLFNLIQLTWLSGDKARALMTNAIKITGNVELAQQVKQLVDTIEIDWEGYIARFTSDAMAHHIGVSIRNKWQGLQQLLQSTTKNISDYAHHEWQGIVSAEELEDFYQEIDELSLAVERLEARLNWIKAS